jgi:hypothetical protein
MRRRKLRRLLAGLAVVGAAGAVMLRPPGVLWPRGNEGITPDARRAR